MRYYRILLWVISMLFFEGVLGQEIIGPNQVDMSIRNDTVIIKYQINESPLNRNYHEVDLFFRDRNYRYYKPDYVSGDIGQVNTPGKLKTIQWSALEDDIDLSKKLFPSLLVDYRPLGGPKNTWLSVLIPGMGDGRVFYTKNMTFKPWMRTISSYGLIATGIYAGTHRTRDKIYSKNNPDQFIGFSERETWLFKGDQELFLIAGIGIWLYDIFWVYSQGMKNERLNKILSRWTVNTTGQTSQIGYKFKINR